MANMFENYENLSSQYIPSNLNKTPCAPCNTEPKQPFEDYDAEGKLVGYWWNYGDTINLGFELTGEVVAEDTYISIRDFIINKNIKIQLYNFRHELIDTQLFSGKDHQDFTYTVDYKVNNSTQGTRYTYSNGTYSPVDLPKNFVAGVTYYNQNPVTVNYSIDSSLSSKLTRGVYYCSLIIYDENSSITVISQNDFTLTVK